MTEPTSDRPPADNEEPVPVPGFRSWSGVYLFVIACFVLYLILFAIFTRTYA